MYRQSRHEIINRFFCAAVPAVYPVAFNNCDSVRSCSEDISAVRMICCKFCNSLPADIVFCVSVRLQEPSPYLVDIAPYCARVSEKAQSRIYLFRMHTGHDADCPYNAISGIYPARVRVVLYKHVHSPDFIINKKRHPRNVAGVPFWCRSGCSVVKVVFARAIIRATCLRDRKNSELNSSYVFPSIKRLRSKFRSRSLWIVSAIMRSISEFVYCIIFSFCAAA